MDCECKNCKKVFLNTSNLRKHIKKFHPELVQVEVVNYNFKCRICGNNFNHKKHLRYHEKTHKNVVDTSTEDSKINKDSKKCPLCNFHSSYVAELHTHFQEEHNLILESETLQFSNLASFQEWKYSIESSTKTKYVKVENFSAKTHKTMKFLCHRSGCFNSESKGKRHLKMKGSIKIGGFCPAGFTVVVDLAEKVEVNFIKTHIGHQTDIGQLFLSVSERQSIAEKIALRIPFSTILDEVRDSVRNSELE
ncbi:uncharacterized protein [Diabrotica undecimpunctata]|uniref:uncharacterized protein n=1 Tax=Diabrotica undecimpunctata TaxID=50387 RepID=UPI003B64184B